MWIHKCKPIHISCVFTFANDIINKSSFDQLFMPSKSKLYITSNIQCFIELQDFHPFISRLINNAMIIIIHLVSVYCVPFSPCNNLARLLLRQVTDIQGSYLIYQVFIWHMKFKPKAFHAHGLE